jgi:dTDP-4-dehydrorhamnose 3,5-epimerase
MKNAPRMNFTSLEIQNSLAVTLGTKLDDRGSLTRIWEANSVLKAFKLDQASIVNNPVTGTLRGLHYQSEPYSENKFIQCVSGKVFDVILDLRKDSITYKKHIGIEIGFGCAYQGLFVPAGCAHGYLTLELNSTLIYFMDKAYSPENSKGVRWNDPKLLINWPRKPTLVSQQDLQWPGLEP